MFKTYPLIPRWSLNGVSLPSYRWSSNVRYSTSGQQHHLHGFIIHLACHRNARKPLEFFDGICDFLLSSWRTSVHWFHVFILFKIALLERKKERETEIYRLFIQQHSRGHSRSHAIKKKSKTNNFQCLETAQRDWAMFKLSEDIFQFLRTWFNYSLNLIDTQCLVKLKDVLR